MEDLNSQIPGMLQKKNIATKVEFTHLMIRLKAVAFKIPTLANLLQDDR